MRGLFLFVHCIRWGMPYFSSTNSTCLGTVGDIYIYIIYICPTKLKFQCTLLFWPYWFYLLKLKQHVGFDQILTSCKEGKTSIGHVSLDSSGTVLLIYSANSKSFFVVHYFASAETRRDIIALIKKMKQSISLGKNDKL